MIVYKVTDGNKETRGGMQWEIGKKNTESGQGPFPGGGWLHAYASPEMAAIFHPAHVSFAMPRMFRAEVAARYRTSIQRFRATYQPKHRVLVDGTHRF